MQCRAARQTRNGRRAAADLSDRSGSGENSVVQVERGNSGIGATELGRGLAAKTSHDRSGRPENAMLGQAPGAIKRKIRLAMRVCQPK